MGTGGPQVAYVWHWGRQGRNEAQAVGSYTRAAEKGSPRTPFLALSYTCFLGARKGHFTGVSGLEA